MIVESIETRFLRIPFRTKFAHASASREVTQAIWVTARAQGGTAGYGEGCPREYVTGESLDTAQAFVAAGEAAWRGSIRDTSTLVRFVETQHAVIDRHPSAWAAVELALLDLIGKTERRPLESLLGLPRLVGRFHYTAVLGDAPAAAFESQLATYRSGGFRDFKVKLAGDPARDRAKVRALSAAGFAPASVRADANNRWPDADSAIAYLRALDFPFWAVEEPLRAGDFAGMRRVSAALGARIVLDESVVRAEDLDAIEDDPSRWIVNVRVSKMGGLVRSLRLADATRRHGLALIVGAHVGETSVLTRAGLALANAARDRVMALEGGFGTHLLERDVIDPALMFGRGGVLDATALDIGVAPGLGLAIDDPAPAADCCAQVRQTPVPSAITSRHCR